MLSASVEVICYKSKRLKDGTFPLMLRITKAGKRKYVALGVSAEERHWDFEKNKPKRNCPNKELIEKLIVAKETEYKETALELLANRREFTASSLAGKVERKVNAKTVKEMYEKIMNDLSAGGSFGNYTIYRYSYNSLMKFTHNLSQGQTSPHILTVSLTGHSMQENSHQGYAGLSREMMNTPGLSDDMFILMVHPLLSSSSIA